MDITNHWAKEDIEFVVNQGLLVGTDINIFNPNIPMTRGMLVTVLSRMSGNSMDTYKVSSFTDVKEQDYFMPAIEWAVSNKIVNGVGNQLFAANKPITREEMVAIMVNYSIFKHYN